MILIPDVASRDDVEIIAQRLLDKLSLPYQVNGERRKISASMGISLFPQDGKSPEALIRKADLAMYKAKQKGVNQYAFSDEA